ncbi:transcriptional attenuator, LytR family [Lentibacillus halodurans]|uniref:Transcriptional attenuator, LytR family n=1 Tax=Lentibacillus halodurans TaxID=237679 RepID=A0A1I0ZRU1_9BACI|nr:LCP family protein [Lentibacillus halodurans]SFB28221.1 transcriptional attenuator, LytR family [Lentibacillus halodurans]
MGDKKLGKDTFAFLDEQELQFTEEDRQKTISKIRDNHQHLPGKKEGFLRIFQNHAGPITVSALVIILTIVLLPSLMSDSNTGIIQSDSQQAVHPEINASFSVLLLGKEDTNNRMTVNILLTYNSDNRTIKMVPIPRDTYAPIFDADGEMITRDKLLYAYVYGSGPESAMASVSDLFSVTVDYYAVIPTKEFADSVVLTKNDVRNDQAASKVKKNLSIDKIKNLISQSETNMPEDKLNTLEVNSGTNSIEVVDMNEGLEPKMNNGIYYKEINQDMLDNISSILKKHLTGN